MIKNCPGNGQTKKMKWSISLWLNDLKKTEAHSGTAIKD